MKPTIIFPFILLMLLTSTSITAQTTYGYFNSETGETSLSFSPESVQQKFEAQLGDPKATVSDVSIWSDETKKVFALTAKVQQSESNINRISILLEKQANGSLVIANSYGPGVVITCHGDPCNECELERYSGIKIRCACREAPCRSGNCHCSMTLEARAVAW